MSDQPNTPARGNGAVPPVDFNDAIEKLKPVEDLAKLLLMPSPSTLSSAGEVLAIPVISKPGPLEYFRTHPDLRLTLEMVCPNKGDISALNYGVMPAARASLARHHIEPFTVTLYPIVICSQPLVYRLVMVKLPSGPRWDNWNLTKKIALDKAVTQWVALRSIKGGYWACDPDPEAVFPDPEFPGYTAHDWLQKSLGVQDQIIRDDSHPVFKEIKHL
jgi:hypothetical protein